METKLDVLADQWEKRFTALQWMVGLSIAWNTMLIGTAMGVLLTYR
jgi:hypothetical protein